MKVVQHGLLPNGLQIGESEETDQPLVLGFDIGGANIKAANSWGQTLCCAFPLWQKPDQLAKELNNIVAQFPEPSCFAITMTGELADCFLDRAEGVARIIQQCQKAFGPRTLYYSVDGIFLSAGDAAELPDCIAASNWHALAAFVAPFCGDMGLLVDIGSTTCDIIPIRHGRPATTSRTDFDRLSSGELVYLGIGRTPVCSVVEALPVHGRFVPVMNEVFANMDDCVILLRQIAEQPTDCTTCDGRPRTIQFAANRLARMVGLDRRNVSVDEAIKIAEYVVQQWRARIQVAAEILAPPGSTWLLSGHGTKMLELTDDRRYLDLSVILGEALNRAAPAYAVARLAATKLSQVESPSLP